MITISGLPTQHAHACPACGAAVRANAIVEAFGEPAGWQFYGQPGDRWKRCEGERGGYNFVHFIVGSSHRLAWSKL